MAGSGCSAAIDLPKALSLFEVGATATVMVFPFCSIGVYCCTRSVLVLNAVSIAMLGYAGGYEYVGAGVGARARRGA